MFKCERATESSPKGPRPSTWTIMPKHQEDPRGDPPDAMKKRSVKECPEAESQRFGIRYVGTMVDAECDLFLHSLQSPVQSIETTS
jgi:hypothetical protein